MRILYFAWLREKTGRAADELTPPQGVETPRALIAHLRTLTPGHRAAFENEAVIRCALDREFAALDAPLGGAREIAFFPPVTGG